MVELRPYQENALFLVLQYANDHPRGRILLVIPPRGGKTPTAARAVREVGAAGAEVLWVVNRIELLDQAVKQLVDCGISFDEIDVIAAKRSGNPKGWCHVASEDTLDLRSKPKAQFVVWDEAQHDAAPRRRRIRGLYPDAFHLGITGTPERLGGVGLERDYDHMIVAVQPSELIHDEYLAVPDIFAPDDEMIPSMRAVREVGGDYHPAELDQLMNRQGLVENLVREWVRLGENRQTIIFPVTVEHSRSIVGAFQRAGIDASHLDGDTKMADRQAMISGLRAGKKQIVSSVGVVSEGIDIKQVKCVVLARPTKSLGLFLQQGARCMTPWPKGPSARILDAAGNTYRHGLPYQDRDWVLEGRRKRRERGGRPLVKRCTCGALASVFAKACGSCGKPYPRAPLPEITPSELRKVEVTPAQVAADRVRLEAFAQAKQFDVAWVNKVLAAKYGIVAPT
jgi:superfamily II DNA or RNA helicase